MKFSTPAILVGLAAVSAVVGVASGTSAPVSAALDAGAPPANSVSLQPATGDSGTVWKLVLDGDDDFCPGDGIDGYRWSTFIVSPEVDIAATTWDGPIAGAPNVTNGYPLTDDLGTFIVNQFPGIDDGFVNPPLEMTFNTALGGVLTAGDWQIGVACTLQDTNGIPRTEKYWAGLITLSSEAGAGPFDFTYAVSAPVDTTTSTTTTVDDGATTTTTSGDGTTTTTSGVGTTTTTADGASTTTTTAGSGTGTTTTISSSFGGATTTVFRSSGGTGSTGGPGQLASTGSSSIWFVVSAILLLIAGRLILLSSRPITVLAPLDRDRRR